MISIIIISVLYENPGANKMDIYGSCLVWAKEGEGEALKALLTGSKDEDIKDVNEISQCLISVAFHRRLDSHGIEVILSPFKDKIEKWQPNYRIRSLTG